MKKVFSLFLVITLILNFVSFSYADNTIDRLIDIEPDVTFSPPTSGTKTEDPTSYGTSEGGSGAYNLGLLGPIWSIFEGIFNVIPRTLANVIYLLPTIDGIIFNTNNIFNITVFDASPDGLSGSLQASISSIYNAFRYLVTAVYIVVLVYLAVRMMLSSIGRQKAKYKELFKYWIIGLLMLFSFHWVMAFFVWISNEIVDILATTTLSLFGECSFDKLLEVERVKLLGPNIVGKYPITNYIVDKILFNGDINLGTVISTLLMPLFGVVFISLLLWSAFSIIVTYFKRLFTVLVLILLFPIVVLSYVFDKIGDRKAQTFSIWLKEFVTNVMIQPIHALILTFIGIILVKSSQIPILRDNTFFAPLFCLLALRLIPMGEELLKKLFQISSQMGPGSRGIAGSMAQAGMALRGAKDMTKAITSPLSNMKKRRDITKQHKDDYANNYRANYEANRAKGMDDKTARSKASLDASKKYRADLQKDLKAANVNSRTRSAMMAAGSLAGFGTAITGAGTGQYLSKAITSAALGSTIAGGLAGVPKKVDEFFRGDATKAEDYNKRADELSKIVQDEKAAKNLSEEQKKKIAAELKIDIGRVNELLANPEGRKKLVDSYRQMGRAMQWGADSDKASKLTYLNTLQSNIDKKRRDGGLDAIKDLIDPGTIQIRNDGTYAKTKNGKDPIKISDYADKSLKDGESRSYGSSQKGQSVQMAVREYLRKSDPDYMDLLGQVPAGMENLSTKDARKNVEDKRREMEEADKQYRTALRKSQKAPGDKDLEKQANTLKTAYDDASSAYVEAQELSETISTIRSKEKQAKKVLIRDDVHFTDSGLMPPTYTETFLHNLDSEQEPKFEVSGHKVSCYYESEEGIKYYTAEFDGTKPKNKLVAATAAYNAAVDQYGTIDNLQNKINDTSLSSDERSMATSDLQQVVSANNTLEAAQREYDEFVSAQPKVVQDCFKEADKLDTVTAAYNAAVDQCRIQQSQVDIASPEQRPLAEAKLQQLQQGVVSAQDTLEAARGKYDEFVVNLQQPAPNKDVARFLWNESSTPNSAVKEVNRILDDYQENSIANPLPSNFSQLETQAMQEIGSNIINYSSNPDLVSTASNISDDDLSALSGAFVFNAATQDNVDVSTISISSLSSVGRHGDLFAYGICDGITTLLEKWSAVGLVCIKLQRTGNDSLTYEVVNKFSKEAIGRGDISINESFQNDRLSNNGNSLTIVFDNGQWYQIQQ